MVFSYLLCIQNDKIFAYSRRFVVRHKRKYVHEVLVNCLVKLAQEKVWLGELTVST